MAIIETYKAYHRDELVAVVDIHSDGRFFTVYDRADRPMGTIIRHRKANGYVRWGSYLTDGSEIPGLIVGPRGALRKLVRAVYPGPGLNIRAAGE